MKHGTFHRLFMIKMTEVIEVTETITVLIENDLSNGIKNDVCPDLNFACLPCAVYRLWRQQCDAQSDRSCGGD
ncbi:hypothetical protein [Candidatus Villigracilis saccharophilus]|uniref:hypothetical protein n=1 Tax=Candidatus Villigracilis saccharophilus TaxID=3140684 RepID=UPI003135488D|nr:hypothetical protein [Anaerolineales bacterium]